MEWGVGGHHRDIWSERGEREKRCEVLIVIIGTGNRNNVIIPITRWLRKRQGRLDQTSIRFHGMAIHEEHMLELKNTGSSAISDTILLRTQNMLLFKNDIKIGYLTNRNLKQDSISMI